MRSRGRLAMAVLLAVPVLVWSGPARAHEGEEDVPAKEFVDEAIALIATQPEQMDAIEDEIADALESEDLKGVDVELLEQAQAAFEDGEMDATLLLLERSVGARPGEAVIDPNAGVRTPAPPPPSLESANTHLRAIAGVEPPGADTWVLLALAGAFAVAGAVVVRRFR